MGGVGMREHGPGIWGWGRYSGKRNRLGMPQHFPPQECDEEFYTPLDLDEDLRPAVSMGPHHEPLIPGVGWWLKIP